MPEKQVIFLPYKLHQQYAIRTLAEHIPVTIMVPPEKQYPDKTIIHSVPITYWQFGFNILKKVFSSETRTLKYVRGLSNALDQINIGALITFEFYHWYTFQCIAYKKRHPEIKLFVVSETKLWPQNIIARISKRILCLYFRLNLKYIDGVFVYNQAAREFIQQYVPGINVTLLPTPVDTTLFQPITNRTFLRNGELRLLMNARFSPYKRYNDLFDAVNILIKEGARIQVTCISRYENDRTKIMTLATKKGVAHVVTVIDPLPPTKMPELYSTHDVLVLPSYNEAIGLVVPEAMACGTPTITSDTVGANIYVTEGETGLIFQTGNITALADCIRQCGDQKVLEKYGKQAAIHIHKNFTPEIYVQTFMKTVYKETSC